MIFYSILIVTKMILIIYFSQIHNLVVFIPHYQTRFGQMSYITHVSSGCYKHYYSHHHNYDVTLEGSNGIVSGGGGEEYRKKYLRSEFLKMGAPTD